MSRTAWNKLPPEEKRRRNAERCRRFYAANREDRNAKGRAYQQKHKERLAMIAKAYYAENKEAILAKSAVYRKANRPLMNAIASRYKNDRRKTDPGYQLRLNIRERIRAAIRFGGGSAKAERTMILLGCSIDRLRGFLEAQFEIGMTWENYGQWHVDHIIPCAGFDLTDPEAQKQCFHYTNLQPLWAKDNIAKGSLLPNGERARVLVNQT